MRNETNGNESPCAQSALGRRCCGGDRGESGIDGWWMMIENECKGIERYVSLGGRHTRRAITGLVHWGPGALI